MALKLEEPLKTVFSEIPIDELIYVRKSHYQEEMNMVFLRTGIPNLQIAFPKSIWPKGYDPRTHFEGWVRIKSKDESTNRIYISTVTGKAKQIEIAAGGVFLGVVKKEDENGWLISISPSAHVIVKKDFQRANAKTGTLCVVRVNSIQGNRILGSFACTEHEVLTRDGVTLAEEPPRFEFYNAALADVIKECEFPQNTESVAYIYSKIREDYVRALEDNTMILDSNPWNHEEAHYSFPSSFTLDRPLGQATPYYGIKVLKGEKTYLVEKFGLKTKNLHKILETDIFAKNWNDVFDELAELALPENWGKPKHTPTGVIHHPILQSYFVYTYYVAKTQGKVVRKELGSDNITIFNTGLVDSRYEYIYAVMADTIGTATQKLTFLGFTVVGNGTLGKKISKMYSELPDRVQYVADPGDLFLDTKAAMNACDIDLDHIATPVRLSRLPLKFLRYICALDDEASEILQSNDGSKWQKLSQRFNEKDTNLKYRLAEEIRAAKDIAVKRTEWNYKTAIPIYFAARHTLSTIIPLTLPYTDVSTGRVDAALVLSHNKASGRYQAETVLTLDMAYANSRQIARPDSDWLIAPEVEADFEDDDD